MAVLISHRFSTVRMADRILVLADGSIREQGTRGNLENLKRKKTCPQEWGQGRRGRLRYKREKEDE
jgi:ABC-type transport system involved in Fe-S cluster assembly fused permease/ATPase subunit